MSIYPVRVTEWYDDKENAFHTERDTLKMLLKHEKCHRCKKPMSRKWKTAWVMHSITWGYGEAWCTRRCLRGAE